MDNKTIKSILEEALDEEIPSSQVNLLPAVKASLAAGKRHSVQQGEKMKRNPSRRTPRAALITLAVLALMALVLTTPPGRALAQNLLQFFTRAESNSFHVQPLPSAAEPGNASLSTAEPPSPLVSVTEAEGQAGFDAAQLPVVPDGFQYLGARLYGNAISLEYEAQGGGGSLILMQSREGFLQSDWDRVPAEAVIPVTIGGQAGEFAQGTFVVPAGASSAAWNPEAPILRLRWLRDGVWFEMTKFGDVQQIEYLDRDAMIALAERLTTEPFPLTLAEAETQAGFDILEPAALPSGMTFLGSSFDPFSKAAALSFGYSAVERSILIQQQPVSSPETCDLCILIGAGASVETVEVRGTTGEYVIGVWQADEAGNWTWTDDPFLQRLRWQQNGTAFEILYMGPPDQMTKADLVAIAESMK